MSFQRRFTVRFRHCDAAGIAFYPRYFEMVNDVLEDFFSELGVPFPALHHELREGVPTVKLEAAFARPSYLGDELLLELEVMRLGTSSFELAFHASCDGEERFHVTSTLCYVSNRGRGEIESRPLPTALREGMVRYLAEREVGREG